jgi:hypothetical protein
MLNNVKARAFKAVFLHTLEQLEYVNHKNYVKNISRYELLPFMYQGDLVPFHRT